ncbi:protein-glutamate O-methyltransferase CheR [Phenylobacterium sp.]|uniref:CheR family methyltransferase n=1 Tax=Phenylobacterium sp. TaxID=1871053 RepID=UPI0035B0820F
MKIEHRILIADLCAARAGLKVDPDKTYLLESRLAPVARREGFASLAELAEAVQANQEEKLAWAVVEAMAAGETAFFRDREPFRLFRDEVLPALARRREGRPIRLWSAGCGSGQEVYSLAMIVDEMRGALGGARVELFASDISERALEKAQSGVYTQFEVQRGLPIRKLVDHFEKVDEMWAISPRIRQMVRWRRVNLAADFAGAAQFDIIFCRNVLDMMLERVQARVLDNLAKALAPDGFLFLGQAESPAGLTHAVQPVAGRSGLFMRNPAHRAAA